MHKTVLKYMDHQYLYTDQVTVLACEQLEDGRYRVLVDQTIFYPQGGGQPYDQGIISSLDGSSVFDVQEVRFDAGYVYHIGTFKQGLFAPQQPVNLSVNQERRILHNKYHTGGHLIDIAMRTVGFSVSFVSFEELQKASAYVPDYLPKEKPIRIMVVNDYPAIPCGGTHVPNTSDFTAVTVDKIKNKKGFLRVSYSVE